jgi:hypothetical protein
MKYSRIFVGIFLAVVAGVAVSQVGDVLAQWAAANNAPNLVVASPASGNGSVKLRALVAADIPVIVSGAGTTFTIASGCATTSALTGGRSTGSFATTTTGTCTPVINLPTAPNGWICDANDITHPVGFVQTASTVNSCTISATTTSGDTILFHAIGF